MSQSNRKHFLPKVEGLEGRLVPATLTVTTFADEVNPADGVLSLREAITRANATAAPDTIVLRPGVYRIGLAGAGEDGNATGDFDVTNPLTILGQGAGNTVLDAVKRDRLFEIHGTYGVGFGGLTLRNGAMPTNLEAHRQHGGAIQALTASLSLNGCVVTANRAMNGGGIYARGGNVTLVGSTLFRNVAKDFGGGINLETGTLTLRGSAVGGNLAGRAGGGIFSNTATLTNSTISGNSSMGSGGGIIAATMTVTNCTVSGNVGAFGGGINANTATLTNCTVSGNRAHAGGSGGGIFANRATLLNTTVTRNSATSGGGVFFQMLGGTFSVRNSIIAQNLVEFDGNGPDVKGAFVSQGHNLIGDPTGGTGFGGNGDQVGTPENPIDPRLAPLALNGGRTMTHALLAGSRAIDRGDNAGVPATDQRGVARRRDGDGNRVAVVDIGAFER